MIRSIYISLRRLVKHDDVYSSQVNSRDEIAAERDLSYGEALFALEVRSALRTEFDQAEPPGGLWEKVRQGMESRTRLTDS